MSDKTIVIFNTRIEKGLKDKLKILAATSSVSMQDHFMQALRDYFEKLEKQTPKK